MAWTLRDSKSHSPEELMNAIRAGKRLAALDSGTSGNDDILIMEDGETLDTLRREVEDWLDLPDGAPSPWEDGPNRWTLREFGRAEIADLAEENEHG